MALVNSFWVAVLVALAVAGCSKPEAPIKKSTIRPVKLATVQDSTSGLIRSFPGKVMASQVAELSFRLNGELIDLNVKEGQQVTKGTLLAKLDDSDMQNQLSDRKASYDLALADHQRKLKLYNKGTVSRSVYDEAKAKLASTKAALELAQDNVQYTVLKAPFDGTVAKTLVDNHQSVQAKQPILLLENHDYIDISLQIPEQLVANIRKDARQVNYKPTAYFASQQDTQYEVQYKEHSTQVTPGTQTYEVLFTMAAPKGMNILPGMSATVTIDFSKISRPSSKNAVIVPVVAVDNPDQGNKAVVWRYDPAQQTVEPVEVTLGQLLDEGIQVLTGIKPGDQIVVAGIQHLQAGLKVKPWVKERGL
ncbi:efflux RND transporter periplasmic adaptor subunit [Endozoicomonas sp. SM1973]|uniref:Efflux RND transporter periplasmic adaptor subunit n=1 Tax=Spartinivicinus marinus TaxID=2994442 RepID=A0A853HVI0_9GAMM|nr:efflux RND transporter periplasmic adaptor subunit [Spartinivicinus marinus]MCX4026583.1 efflux RND transporter periplasmic adaptor subunit [Spartinivicinus marinus]NYZ64419.1 efflux RND transporter periplasmic adaptor subunit [Spartinivicinus marinus]